VAGRRPHRARALARALGGGVRATGDAARAVEGCGLVLLALPESALEEVASGMAEPTGFDGRGRTFLHTSGIAPDAALAALRERGAAAGRLHPLYPFTGHREDARRLKGVSFGVGGDEAAVRWGRRLARALGGRAVEVPPGAEIAHHLSAVLASNLLVALASAAARAGASIPRDRDRSLRALLPLLRATIENLEVRGLPGALTGPLMRGDADTVRAHLDLLGSGEQGDLEEIYRGLSRLALSLAGEGAALAAGDRRALERLLAGAGRGRRGS
jgi:predicted short-subunit dehydrogenase-like oxidoreductase (DUF2520 family)